MIQLGFVWSLLLFCAWLWVSRTGALRWSRWSLWAIVLVAFAARLVPLALLDTGAPFDIQSYGVVADLVRNGSDVYNAESTVNRHPYLPLHLYWLAAARAFADASGISFVKVVKLLPVVADIAIAALIVWYLRRRSPTDEADAPREEPGTHNGSAERAGILYALNPVPILICAYHGQFDAEPVLFMLLATVMVALSGGAGMGGSWGAGAWLGLGILTKSYPVLALPTLLPSVKGWGNRARFLIAMAAVPLIGVLLYSLLFDAPILSVMQRAVGYNFGIGIYGYTWFARLARELGGDGRWLQWAVEYGRYLTVALLALVWWFRARHESAPAALLTILVAFFAVTHAFAIQYLGWLVPIALINREFRWVVAYTVAAFFYMAVAYWGLIFAPGITALMPLPQADYLLVMSASLPIWVISMVWLWKRLSSKP